MHRSYKRETKKIHTGHTGTRRLSHLFDGFLGEFLFCPVYFFTMFFFLLILLWYLFFFLFFSHPSSASYQAFKEGGARVYSITEQGWPGRVIGSV